VTTRSIAIAVGAVVLVGGGALLARAPRSGGSEQRDLSRALAALERQEQALQRLEQRSEGAPSTIVVNAPSARESPGTPLPAAAIAAQPAPAPSEPSNEQLDAEIAARVIVDRASSGGQWGDRELSSFREQFDKLTRAQQASVLQSISQAINEGRFRPDPTRMPF
jgi:hypothetical protein